AFTGAPRGLYAPPSLHRAVRIGTYSVPCRKWHLDFEPFCAPRAGEIIAINNCGPAARRGTEVTAMNYLATPRQPFIALVDDDTHSARLITRMLLAHGAPHVHWLDSAEAGASQIGQWLNAGTADLPGLVIADLKSSSGATRDFIAA